MQALARNLLTATLAGLVLAAPAAHATTVLNFEGAALTGLYLPGDSQTLDGFVLTTQGDFGIVDLASALGALAPSGNATQFYFNSNDGRIVLTRNDALPFSLDGFAAAFVPQDPPSAQPTVLVAVGTRADSSTVTAWWNFAPSLSSNFPFPFANYSGTSFASLGNLRQLEIKACSFVGGLTCTLPTLNNGQFAIDNLTVTPVPEPGPAALLGMGLAVMAWRRRRAMAGAALSAVALTTTSVGASAQTREAAGSETRARVTYIVQLAGAPLASYDGRVAGLAATRPAAGARLAAGSNNARAYLSHLDQRRAAVLARVPGIRPLHTYSVTFNGFAAQLTPAQISALLASADVVSVVPSEVRQLDTVYTADFLGLTQPGGLHTQLDTQSNAVKGENVIIGVLDSGIWPESPAFGDKVDANGRAVGYNQPGTQVYGPPPAQWNGACDAGQGFNPATMCSNKLIGARFFSADFAASGAVRAALEYLSPRDGANSGHGTHTASTAGGNAQQAITAASGVVTNLMTGIAPRARIAAYKVCWTATVAAQTGCYTADMLAAVDAAVSDGVDVINFSISGTQLFFNDPIEMAFLNASTAGVFVAASAGNSGPGNEVAHMSPWLATVGASTHDRSQGGYLTLGNTAVYSGGSTNFFGVVNGNMVPSTAVAAAGQATGAVTCAANSLDPALAAGRIIVCDVSSNTAATRLASSAEVQRAGGLGAVLTNTASATIANDAHTLPTIHISNASRTVIRDYLASAGAAAAGTVGLSTNIPGVNAPVMAGFSSRGPNKADANILKPDITAPGVAIVASNRPSLSAAQRDAVAAGTLTPPWSSGSLQGTSMSSPHIAGSAALLKQLYPGWSPAAIKSALMTTTSVVRLAGSGATDTNRWGYGAGHVLPNGAAVPSLVYDAGVADYGRFLCGVQLAPPAGQGGCGTLGVIKPWNLNLSSLTAARVVVSRTLERTVKNVGPSTATFASSASLPGWDVVVTPASLTLAPGASASFTARITRTSATLGAWTFGNLSWSDGVRTITSPLSAQPLAFSSPVEVGAQRSGSRGSRIFTVESSFTGTLALQRLGLVPAVTNSATVATGAAQCYSFTVPGGTAFARWQLFNADTQGGVTTDLDLDVYQTANCTGTPIGTSAVGGSDEVVTRENPAAATYSARVTGYATPAGGAAYTLSTWIVGTGGTPTLNAVGPSAVYAGGSASVALSWSVPAGARYMGQVNFLDSSAAVISTTKVLVDNR